MPILAVAAAEPEGESQRPEVTRMQYAIIGCGSIGMDLARRWVSAGHEVIGTTTAPDRVPRLKEVCTEVVVLRGTDEAKVRDAVREARAVVVAVNPKVDAAMSRRERLAEYRDTLVGTVRTVVGAHRRVVLLSSTLVYGSADQGDGPVDEETLRTLDFEPAAQAYAAAERMVMEVPTGTVVRLPVEYDQPEAMDPAALAYGVDPRDAAAAAQFVVDRDLTGLYNAVPDDTVPPTYAEVLPGVSFQNQIKAPTRPISSAKLRGAGFSFQYPATRAWSRDSSAR
jgi:nucleoside-diphosphate-sugar epimerase